MKNLLKIDNLKTYFYVNDQEIKAVDGVSFHVNENEILAVVGESGSGKSVTALSVMRLHNSETAKIKEGEIYFKENNILKMTEKQLLLLRGNRIAMIYQDPMNSLNPRMPVGNQIAETLLIHKKATKKTVKKQVIELMEAVGISEPAIRYNELPSEFSGGMRQRIMVAIAIACNPELLIADEPTTALDVTIQAEIMKLLVSMKQKLNMSIILITHDLGLVAENADRVVVMYGGKVMEEANVYELFGKPMHPYTVGLMQCIPRVDLKVDKLNAIPGYVPHPTQYPTGCRFSNRCGRTIDKCHSEMPELIEIEPNHKVRCWLYNHSFE